MPGAASFIASRCASAVISIAFRRRAISSASLTSRSAAITGLTSRTFIALRMTRFMNGSSSAASFLSR
jgi:hypothetical protein